MGKSNKVSGQELRVDDGTKVCKRCERGSKYKHGHDKTCPKSKYYVDRVGGTSKGNSNNNIKKKKEAEEKTQEDEKKQETEAARTLKQKTQEKQTAEKKTQEANSRTLKQKAEEEKKVQAAVKNKEAHEYVPDLVESAKIKLESNIKTGSTNGSNSNNNNFTQ